MQIKTAEFIRGVIGSETLPRDSRPQYAFVGRSNVGKSSVINSILGTKDLVKSSSKPGCTQQINYFLINDKFYLVDLPGYGYAKISQKQREKMRRMIIWYLSENDRKPDKVFLIVDAKVGLKEFDSEMVELLRESQIPFVIIANKIDKIGNSIIEKSKKKVLQKAEGEKVIFYSAKSGKGKGEVHLEIED